MTAPLFLMIAVAGGLGAVCRLLVDRVTPSDGPHSLPIGTLLINTSGSFALGLLMGLGASFVVPEAWLEVLGIGFLGGYTTFSTASFETVGLFQEGEPGKAVANGLGGLVLTVVAAGLGLWLGTSF